MLINHKHKFIFVHIYKVAGTSVFNALTNDTYPSYVPSAARPGITRFLRKFHLSPSFPLRVHSRAKEIREKTDPEIYNSYYKFAFVRNPWDWQVSLYEYGRRYKNHPDHKIYIAFKDFEEYLHWRIENEGTLQKDFVTDNAGQLIVDFVGKFERLSEDFASVCDHVGIDATLPHYNQTKSRKRYIDYYTDETRELVQTHFKDDIEFFDYSFGA
ncbi:MAG: sulfotransferase family 2 domain-containing protein [Cyanobacteria bacterium P01_F01_bin.53]